jgi:hypothetical protein
LEHSKRADTVWTWLIHELRLNPRDVNTVERRQIARFETLADSGRFFLPTRDDQIQISPAEIVTDTPRICVYRVLNLFDERRREFVIATGQFACNASSFSGDEFRTLTLRHVLIKVRGWLLGVGP